LGDWTFLSYFQESHGLKEFGNGCLGKQWVFGIRLGLPHVKKLTGTQLWELRILGSDSLRVLYIAMTGKTFVLLHGFKKKKDKTPPKEIKIAEGRLDELRSRIK